MLHLTLFCNDWSYHRVRCECRRQIRKVPCPCASLDFCRYTKIGNWRVYLGEETEGPEGVSCLPCGLAPKRLKKNAWKTEVRPPVTFCGSLTQSSLFPNLHEALGFSEQTPLANWSPEGLRATSLSPVSPCLCSYPEFPLSLFHCLCIWFDFFKRSPSPLNYK